MSSRITWAVAVVFLAVALPAAAQQSPPAPLPLAELSFPDFEERTLSNGANVIVVPQHELPFVSVNLILIAGSARDPAGLSGLASMTAQLLNKGTRGRNSLEVAEEVDFIGANLFASAGRDRSTVSLGALTPDLPVALEVMADIVMNPTFPADELELLRTQTLTALQFQRSQASAVADENFRKAVYGNHPYGQSEGVESVEAITREGVSGFHTTFYRPNNALFIVAGDVDADEVTEQLDRAFRGWGPQQVPTMEYPAVPERTGIEVLLVNKPGSVQSAVRIGHALMRGVSDDWTAFNVANQVLGAGSTGRLFMSLREESGWTYGAYSSATRSQDVGMLRGFMEVRNAVTDSAVAGMLDEFHRIRAETVPTDELERVKSFLVGSFPRQIETPQQIAGQVATYRLLGLTQEDLETYRSRVAELTVEDIHRVANERIDPDNVVIVVVGDATQVADKLERFGPVTIVDLEGRPISMGDLEVKASAMSFEASALSPGSWTYSVSFQGTAVGSMERTLVVDPGSGNYTFSSHMSAGPQTSEQVVVFTPSFAPISSSHSVAAGGMQMGGETRIENGRAVGSFSTPQGENSFDEELVAGTLIGDMDELAVWLTDLDANPEFTFPVFSAQAGTTVNVSVRVVGTTEVTVPVGTFDAYEVEITGAEGMPRTVYLSREAPHLMLKLNVAGQPVVIELTVIN